MRVPVGEDYLLQGFDGQNASREWTKLQGKWTRLQKTDRDAVEMSI